MPCDGTGAGAAGARVIVYHAASGLAAVNAARRHLGLGSLHPPGRGERDRPDLPTRGELRLVGVDQAGWRVCALDRGRLRRVAARALAGVAGVFGLSDRVRVLDADGDRRRGGTRPLPEPPPSRGRAVGAAAGGPYPAIAYTCFGAAHSSVVAAALHAGLLRSGRAPRPAELLALPDFDRLPHAEIGVPLLIGRDAAGRPLLALGLGSGRRVLPRAIYGLLAACDFPTDRLLLVDALQGATCWLRAGGFLSRRLGWVGLGRPLCVQGVRREFQRFERIVAETRRRVAATASGASAPRRGEGAERKIDAPFAGRDNVWDASPDAHPGGRS